jgi:DNA-binding beta-propeller fold protein YncE
MKRQSLYRASLLAVLAVFANLTLGGKSISAETTGVNVFTLVIGDSPSSTVNGVFFDGKYIWAAVQNPDGGVLEKMDTTGVILSTTGIGSAPLDMVFDGTNIWVTEYTSSDVRIVSQQGVPLKTISLPLADPEGIVFDGKYVWVANNGNGTDTVSKFDAASMTLINSYRVGRSPDGVAFDGANIWVTNSYNNNVWVLDRETGEQLAGYPTGIFPLSMAFDGSNMWIGNGTGVNVGPPVPGIGSLTKIRASDGANLGSFTIGNHVRGLVYDGTSIWACNANDNTVSRLRASNVALLGTYRTGSAPRAVAYDGTKIWVANSGENTLTVIAPLDPNAANSGGNAIPGARAVAVTSRALVPVKDVDWMMSILLAE